MYVVGFTGLIKKIMKITFCNGVVLFIQFSRIQLLVYPISLLRFKLQFYDIFSDSSSGGENPEDVSNCMSKLY